MKNLMTMIILNFRHLYSCIFINQRKKVKHLLLSWEFAPVSYLYQIIELLTIFLVVVYVDH
jgi:hypothetical protein